MPFVDAIELVDLVVYLTGLAFLLPALAYLHSVSLIAFWILLLVIVGPFPLHVMRLRAKFCERLDSLLEKHAYTTFLAAVATVLGLIGVSLFR